MSKLILCFITICVVTAATAYEKSDIVSAKIETCRGCSLNRLPEVKSFVMDDAPFYDKLDVKFISGAKPELIFLGNSDQELERIGLSDLSRQECNELLLEAGFNKKTKKEEF
ncbi:selenoprotein M [Bicyclus anynana]|uniref:Selenoprotein M n=1 Tax=Bicyclus anynana TaxID=110368 RepID=A0A6J1P3N1_BICAN|nr:selenoprotein M [Bicyclus anynana]